MGGIFSSSKSTVINYLLRLTFCLFCSKLKKILHNPKQRVFFKKIIVEEPEKNVSTPTVQNNQLLIFYIGSFRIGGLSGHFWPKNTVFRCRWGRNVCAGFLLRSSKTKKTSCRMGDYNIQGVML
jgi:hypothetical protein